MSTVYCQLHSLQSIFNHLRLTAHTHKGMEGKSERIEIKGHVERQGTALPGNKPACLKPHPCSYKQLVKTPASEYVNIYFLSPAKKGDQNINPLKTCY